MKIHVLSMRFHGGHATLDWLESLPGDGTAYVTDRLYDPLPGGGRRWFYPDGPEHWEELPRPGDQAAAAQCAIQGADLLYRYPSSKRRRIFVRFPGRVPGTRRKPFTRRQPVEPVPA